MGHLHAPARSAARSRAPLRSPDDEHPLLALQRLAGNQATAAFLQRQDDAEDTSPDDSAPAGGAEAGQTEMPAPVAPTAALDRTTQTAQTGTPPADAPAAAQQTAAPDAAAAPAPSTGSAPEAASAPAPSTGSAPAATAAGDRPHFGFDLSAAGSANVGVVGGEGLRGPSAAQGDLGGTVTAVFVYRNWNYRTFGDQWHFLHEPQVTISGGLGSDASGHGDVAIAADLLHHSWNTGIGQFDWHALSAQLGGGVGYTGAGGVRGEGSLGLGTGVEWHPGDQNRFSITAAINLTGNVGYDSDRSRYVFTAAATPTLGFTWNIVGP